MTRAGRTTIVRPYRPEDAAPLRELAISMDIEARIRLGVDRGEDFLAFNRARYEAWDTYVAEREGEIVGFLDMGYSRYRVGDRTVLGAYAGLTGVRAGARGGRTYAAMVIAGERGSLDRGAAFGLSIANTANEVVPRMLQRRFPRARRGVPIHGVCILLGPAYRQPLRFECRRATPDDLPDVAALLRRSRERALLSSTLEPEGLPRLPDARLEDLLFVRHRGRVVATLGLWDQDALRCVMVRGYAKREAWLRRGFNRLRGLARFAPLPAPGEPLRIVHTLFLAAEPGYEHAWGTLLRHACRLRSTTGHSLLVVGLPATSRLLRTCRGLPRFKNVNIPLVLGWDPAVDRAVHAGGTPLLDLEYATL